jgi:hypothetical protein
MEFPKNCLRGVPNPSFIVEDGSVGSHLFYFYEKDKREDGLIEQSINWEDDDDAIPFTLAQKKEDGKLQFSSGVVVIPSAEIDRLRKRPTVKDLLLYERQTIENNPYHGNILLAQGVPKPTMKMLAAGLALAVSEIVPHP